MNLPNFRVGNFTVGQPYAIFYPTGGIDFTVFTGMDNGMPTFSVDTDCLVWITLWEIREAAHDCESEIGLVSSLKTAEQREALLRLINIVRESESFRFPVSRQPRHLRSMTDAEAKKILSWEDHLPISDAIIQGVLTIKRWEARAEKLITGSWPIWATKLETAAMIMRKLALIASMPIITPTPEPEAPPVVEVVQKPVEIAATPPTRQTKPSTPPVDYSRMSREALLRLLEKELADHIASKS